MWKPAQLKSYPKWAIVIHCVYNRRRSIVLEQNQRAHIQLISRLDVRPASRIIDKNQALAYLNLMYKFIDLELFGEDLILFDLIKYVFNKLSSFFFISIMLSEQSFVYG